jgi:hypothetical protein
MTVVATTTFVAPTRVEADNGKPPLHLLFQVTFVFACEVS